MVVDSASCVPVAPLVQQRPCAHDLRHEALGVPLGEFCIAEGESPSRAGVVAQTRYLNLNLAVRNAVSSSSVCVLLKLGRSAVTLLIVLGRLDELPLQLWRALR